MVYNKYYCSKGKEIDMVVAHSNREIAIEMKAGRTMNTAYFDHLNYWSKLTGNPAHDNWLITGNSDNTMSTSFGQYKSWKKVNEDLSDILL